MSEQSSAGQEPMVVVTRDGGVARVTLNDPRRKNAITLEMAAAIEAFCDEVEADAVEIERGAQMWSLARKGREGWDRKPPKPRA